MSDTNGWTGTPRDDPAAAHLKMIFGDEVPITSPIPQTEEAADVVGEFYELDLKRVTPEQRAKLVEWLAERWHVSDLADVKHELDVHGVPVRAELLVVAIPFRYFV